ncbi:hypothetical protein FK531_14475 [Rhodococcus spelaei]|uniref:Integral membrane protein n=1 Tax=Rhodococcus spelaei TaxID=2546320 RepID=A0A541B7L0_9NOCA|nr:hypothetical protein [Rhodococcus spelaei]TQF68305.1 hypothetical protein FK531_14475 [Rhodococcus spelaei]
MTSADQREAGVRQSRRFSRADLAAAAVAVVLVAVAFVVPHVGFTTVTPLIRSSPQKIHDFAQAAPIFGWWDPHVGWGTPCAVLIGVATVLWGPGLAQRVSWRWLPLVTWGSAVAWAFSLAMVDGWQRGFAGRLVSRDEYLSEVPGVTDIPAMLRGFSARILDGQPDSWHTHVSGHPPGALLTFVLLDRVGLGGGAWAAAVCVIVGASGAAAVVVTIRALGDELRARMAAPFVAIAPAAIWIAVSADGFFAGVTAWGIALLALAVTGTARRTALASVLAGVLLGFGVYLSYGLALMALPAVAVLVVAGRYRPLVGALVGAAAVAAIFTAAGFWWFDGYMLVQERYWQGIATDRPFAYWGWANLASLVCATGIAVVPGLVRALCWPDLRARQPVNLLVVAALLAVLCADLSALSKAETERIWLPFALWLLAAPALLPPPSHRYWLAAQVAGALALNHLLFTNW